ncbi:MAG: FtsW/RodA/SpoVE family cell cycle protein, partial [Acidobacteriaceae bacterium]|nr:FtsW/RodA/SpoVE family cell cycle protein [Acidobacteriaceae bacterium]
MTRSLSFRDFDWVLLFFVLAICGLGVMEIYSATLTTKFVGVHIKQVYWILGGMALMFIVSLIDYHALLDNVHYFYLASIGSLIAVLLFGKKYLGARRWIQMPGGQHFQPSEWVKLILILAMAKYFVDMYQKHASVSDIVKAGAIVGIPMLMVLKQPDLGTALTYIPVLIMALILGGLRLKHALVIMLAAAMLLPVVWHFGLKPYQKERLISFREPEADPQGSGYQIQQSLIAVGSGGIWGKGIAKGTQTQGLFLPVPHT